jgi:hypothetical protein
MGYIGVRLRAETLDPVVLLSNLVLEPECWFAGFIKHVGNLLPIYGMQWIRVHDQDA